MIKLLDIIYEGAYDAQGVGDKAYEKFHIPTDVPNLKTLAELQRQENGKPVAKIGDDRVYVFLNPKSLKYFGRGTRAVADNHGNIYVAQKDGNFIHYDIARAVGLTSSDPYAQGNEFVRLIRNRNFDHFYDVSDYWDQHDHAKAIKALRMKHPQFNILSSV